MENPISAMVHGVFMGPCHPTIRSLGIPDTGQMNLCHREMTIPYWNSSTMLCPSWLTVSWLHAILAKIGEKNLEGFMVSVHSILLSWTSKSQSECNDILKKKKSGFRILFITINHIVKPLVNQLNAMLGASKCCQHRQHPNSFQPSASQAGELVEAQRKLGDGLKIGYHMVPQNFMP